MNAERASAPELVFWPGSLGALGFEATLAAAVAGGFTALAVSPLTLQERGAGTLRGLGADRGVRLTHLDGASSWASVWYSEDMPTPLKQRFSLPPDQIVDLAAGAGMDTILAAGAFAPGTIPVGELAGAYAGFCDLAGEHGLRVELEFVPFWGIRDLATAWDIVRDANRPNGTLMIDSWHLLKGSADPGAALELLPQIPGEFLTGLQLADALQAPQAESLYAEGRFRRFPGDGDLPLADLASTVLRVGRVRHVGAEVFGAAIDDLTIDEAGRRAAASVATTLADIS